MPSISIIICWSASALEETSRAIRKDANIKIIYFMVIYSLLIKMNQHTLKRYGKDESHSANPKYATGDFPRTEILLAAAVLSPCSCSPVFLGIISRMKNLTAKSLRQGDRDVRAPKRQNCSESWLMFQI
jgi:hypothetical protein